MNTSTPNQMESMFSSNVDYKKAIIKKSLFITIFEEKIIKVNLYRYPQ